MQRKKSEKFLRRNLTIKKDKEIVAVNPRQLNLILAVVFFNQAQVFIVVKLAPIERGPCKRVDPANVVCP